MTLGIVDVAMAEEGTIEQPKGSNFVKYNNWYYGRQVSGSAYPWCAVFISWCAHQAGVSNNVLPKTASVDTFISFFRNNNNFHPRGDGYKPQAGDIMCLSGHVGIVYKSDDSNFYTIEGNISDSVGRRTRSLSDPDLVGFGAPMYSGKPSTGDYPTSGTQPASSNRVTATHAKSLGIESVEYKDYIVQEGETLADIAKKFNTTVAMLVFINDLKTSTVTAGMSIKIPVNKNNTSLEDAQAGTQPMTKTHTYSVTVSHPTIKVEFYTEYGAISAVSTTDMIESNTTLDNDIISLTTKRSLSQDCPTFSMNLVWRNKWFTRISSNDLIVIKMQRPPEEERIVMFGLVDDIRRTMDFSSGSPQRALQITGRGFNKAFMNFEVGMLENLALVRSTGFMANMVNINMVNSARAFEKILESYIGRAIKYNFGNGKAFEDYFATKLTAHEGEQIVDVQGYMTYVGSLWNFLKELSNAPFNETYWEVEDSKPTLIHRPTPFNKKEWNELHRNVITDDEIVNDGIGRSDMETYTVFTVSAKISNTLSTDKIYYPLWYKPFYAKFGITQLKVTTPYKLIASASQTADHIKKFFIELFNWNIKNNVFHNGNVTVKGRAKYKIGERAILESENLEFYVESVTQSFNLFQSWITTLGLTRGIEPQNRFTAPWGEYEEFTPSVVQALFNQTGGSKIDWGSLPKVSSPLSSAPNNTGGYGTTNVGPSGKNIGSPSQNEITIANFLQAEGFHNAGIAAILANLQNESNFNPGEVAKGDGSDGSDSIGIVQWNSGRAEKLKAYCRENNYDVWSLTGQLNFLMKELKENYSWVFTYLLIEIPNNSEGARLGALKWASDYEVCAVQYRAKRGEDAVNIWYPRYCGR